MAFFNNLSRTLSEKGKEAVKKAKGLTETMQLKGQINVEESNMNEAFIKIGKLAFESQLSADKSEYEEYFEAIHAIQAKIEELQKEVEKLEGVCTCPNCGAKIPGESSFCNSCGMKINETIELVEGEINIIEEKEDISQELDVDSHSQPELVEKRCAVCGEILEDGASFCSGCGQKIV